MGGLNERVRKADLPSMRPRPLHNKLHARVEAVLDRLRPALIADGGNVELVGVDDDGTVRLALGGACARCPAQLATLRLALEPTLRAEVPAVKAVVAV